jgi:Protein of unknown function (DUF3501)
MKPVERSEIVDYQTYADLREEIQRQVMREKADRRVHVGRYLTFLFETHATIRYQIQEMMRAEQIVRDKDILHEIETYNEVLGGPGELGCTLLIEIDDAEARAVKLARWLDLPDRLYARLEDGTKARPRYDRRQVGETRLSAVQYVKFAVGKRAPVAIGCDHADAEIGGETILSDSQRAALQRDLES